MAFHDCDVEEADILEVQSVSDMFSAFKTPAADAVKLIGGDDIAVFSPQLGLMVVTSQYDLEEPSTTAPAGSTGTAGRRSSPSRSRHTTGRARSPCKTVTTAHRCPPATC